MSEETREERTARIKASVKSDMAASERPPSKQNERTVQKPEKPATTVGGVHDALSNRKRQVDEATGNI